MTDILDRICLLTCFAVVAAEVVLVDEVLHLSEGEGLQPQPEGEEEQVQEFHYDEQYGDEDALFLLHEVDGDDEDERDHFKA